MRIIDPIIVMSISVSSLLATNARAAPGACDAFARRAFETQIIPREARDTEVLERADRKLAVLAMSRMPFQIQNDGRITASRRLASDGDSFDITPEFSDDEFDALGMSYNNTDAEHYRAKLMRIHGQLNRDGTLASLRYELPGDYGSMKAMTISFGSVGGICIPTKVSKAKKLSDRWYDDLSPEYDFDSCQKLTKVFDSRTIHVRGFGFRPISECAKVYPIDRKRESTEEHATRVGCAAAADKISAADWESIEGYESIAARTSLPADRVAQQVRHWHEACTVSKDYPQLSVSPKTTNLLNYIISASVRMYNDANRATPGKVKTKGSGRGGARPSF